MNKLLKINVRNKDYKKLYWRYINDLTTFFCIDEVTLRACIVSNLQKEKNMSLLTAFRTCYELTSTSDNFKNNFQENNTVIGNKFSICCFLEDLFYDLDISESFVRDVLFLLIMACKQDKNITCINKLDELIPDQLTSLENMVNLNE